MNERPSKNSKRKLWLTTALVGSMLAVGGALWVVDQTVIAKGLPDLLGKKQPALPTGALQVQDLESDPKGYTGKILVRGVVAVISEGDPQLIGLIDSREARVCKDLHCARFYLPVKVKETNLKPWDEINVRGTMMEDPNKEMPYLLADEVENLGSIKK